MNYLTDHGLLEYAALADKVVEDGGVMPNPTVEKLYEGSRIAGVDCKMYSPGKTR